MDVYQYFVGEWEGTDRNPKDGLLRIHISIREEPAKHRMRWETTYGVKHFLRYEHVVRYITLDPPKNSVLYEYDGGMDTYTSNDLAEFAKSGIGTFSSVSDRANSAGLLFRQKLSLDQDTLSYEWESSRDGIHFAWYGSFHLSRVNTKRISSH